MKDIGILGGTFDPVHNAHLLLCRQAYEEYALESVWLMPSRNPPHKRDHSVTDGGHRLNMLSLAVAGLPYCKVSDFEMRREGDTYTAQTLALLKEQYPWIRFYFIIGADSLFQIEDWYHPKDVMELADLIVSRREFDQPGRDRGFEGQISYLEAEYGARIHVLHNEEMNVSSAEIREKVAKGEDISGLVPAAVCTYIKEHGLYRKAGLT